jgi:hypothetical protein
VRKIGWGYARQCRFLGSDGVRWVTQYGVSAGMPGELPSDADLPVMSLDTSSLKAEAGGQAQTTLTLRNPGSLVESFRLDVVGLDDGWWQIHPPELALYPGEDSTAVVVLTPPAAARAPDRPLPFGVRAISTLDASRGVVEEGDLEIGRVFDLQPSISPVTSRARWSARHTVTFTNWGNTPVRLKLSATDKDGRLGFQLTPDAVVVPVGGRATARLRVRPSDPFLRGTPVHMPFQVHGEQPGAAAAAAAGPRSIAQRAGVPDPTQPVVDGAVLHGPILSKGVIIALIAVVAAIAAAGALLFRAGDVQGGRTEDTAPPVPTAVKVDAISAELARVSWTGSDRALAYKVRTLDENGAPLKSDDVKGDVQVFDAKLEKTETPRSEVCFEVSAVRDGFSSKASERQCATLPDESLKPPTDVDAVQAAGGQYQVTWKGREKDAHVVLVNGAPAAPSSEYGPGISTALINVPAGKPCITVFAKRGEEDVSPPSAPPKCVEGVAAPTPSAGGNGGNGGGVPVPSESAGNGGNGGPTPGNTGAGAPVTGIVAVLGGPKQSDDNIAKTVVADLNSRNIPARIVPATAVPNHPDGPFQNPLTILVVVENFPSLEQAQNFCTNIVLPENMKPCTPVQAGS